MTTSSNAVVPNDADLFSASSTLIDLLRKRAQLHPERVIYTFLADGTAEEITLTYGELDRQARAVAAWLQSQTSRGERVLLLYPPGLKYITAFFGCLYAGAIAVPAYPPRHNRNSHRLQSLIADAAPSIALTTAPILSRITTTLVQNPELAKLRWVAPENELIAESEDWEEPSIAGDDLAFLQYTSGSTSAPKGVRLSHNNLLHNDRLLRKAFGQTEQSVIVGWLPLYHDMGLIGIVLHTLSVGARCILMSPVAFLQQPFRWLQAISQYRATTSGGPNFSYDLCVRKITDEQRAVLDLSSWSVAFNGAEPIRARTMDRFAAKFAPCGFRREAFRPCYGLAEATLIVSARGVSRPEPFVKDVSKKAIEQSHVVEPASEQADTRQLVGCGGPLASEVIVVNPESPIKCRSGEIGEIWVSGPSVAEGYWNNPDETARTFRAVLKDRKASYLRTGDLGFLLEGELFLTGRLKDLIITRGRNLYPQDIELTVEQCHPSLRPGCGAAFSMPVDDEERLVLVQELEPRQKSEAQSVVESIREAVSQEHEVQVYAVALVRAGTIPKTSSGKIQRRACRQLFLEGGLEIVARWHEKERDAETASLAPADSREVKAVQDWLRSQFATVLKLDKSEIDVKQPILRYGLDSLLATELAHRIEASFGIAMSLNTLLENPTIAQLARQIQDLPRSGNTSANNGDIRPTEYPLALGQQSLWFLHRMQPESAAYNLATALRMHGELDVAALHHTFASLIQRHAALRTTFSQNGGAPMQRVHKNFPVCFEYVDATSWTEAFVEERLAQAAHQPFNLSEGPLLRVILLQRSDREHVMLVVVHHIVADFWSLAVLMKELGVLYEAERRGAGATLSPLQLQYTDHVRQETTRLEGPRGEQLWEYWRKQLDGESLALNLPTDHPRPASQTFHGSSCAFKVSREVTRKLRELARAESATLYMVLLGAFQTLLYRYTEQKEFLVGSPAAARNSALWALVVGYFVNPLVLRADLHGNPSFVELLARVRRTVLDAFAHQDLPFALLVERLQPRRDASRSPLFQHMFVMQQSPLTGVEGLAPFALGENGSKLEFGELVLESIALQRRVALFDLRLEMADAGEMLVGSMEYNTDLFETATIERMLGHFQTLLESIVVNPHQHLAEQSILTAHEKHELVVKWNETKRDYAPKRLLHELIEAQVARTPDSIAVIFEDECLTYAELDERANELAVELRHRGVGPDGIVAVCMERSVELVVALLGVLKAGGAYLPLDPSYPRERLRFMLEDSQPVVLLKQTDAICVEEVVSGKGAKEQRERSVSPKNLAYVIYTSGSTGKPKGAMNTHEGIVNRLLWMQDRYQLTSSDCVLQKTPFSFDVSVWEFFWPLLTGAKLVLAKPGGHQDPAYLAELIEREQVTTIHFVPSMLQAFLTGAAMNRCQSLERVICSGEALSYELQESFHQLLDAELHNLYGPTEASVDVTHWTCERNSQRAIVPIGRPITNTEIYIVDSMGQPVPAGVAGELLIGGLGLGRGYLNRPDLTAERFQPHPFATTPGARLYRSGDLARYQADGQIEYLGRLDQQVKLRGFRIELGEIEAALSAHSAVRTCVVTTYEVTPGDPRLIAYVVHKNETTAEDLRHHLQQRLPEYMVPAFFIRLDQIPHLPNGKIDRRSLPAPTNLRPELAREFVAPRNEIEAEVAEIWAAVLRLERVGIHDNFFELGGHSLLATQIVARINQSFPIDFPLRQMFETPTVDAMAQCLATALRAATPPQQQPIKRAPRESNLPLSFAQQRLWFLEQLEPGNTAYNMPVVLRIRGRLDVAMLERSVQEIIRRHETLRTSIISVNGSPVQVIAPFEKWPLPVFDLSDVGKEDRFAEAIRQATNEAQRPFDLTRGPLLRVAEWQLDEEDHLLMLAMHHVISDGWSLGVFMTELRTLYQSFSAGQPSPLPELPIQYADFAQWQREHLASEALEQIEYWKGQLAGRLPVLALPSERTRRAARDVRVATESCTLPAALHKSLKDFSRSNRATPFMALLTTFHILLQRYTGLDDIVVGTPVASRTRVETEGLIGLFANTLVLRGDLSGNPTFFELLGRMREITLEAHAHQDVPFEMLVEELQPERDLAASPLFQVMIVSDAPLPEIDLPGLQVQHLELATTAPKFDLILFLKERDDKLVALWEYNSARLDEETVWRMAQHFRTLLENALTHPQERIANLELLTQAEQQRLLVEWNDTGQEYPRDVCLHQLFENQVARTPEAVALVSGSERVSYRELNQRANQLAHHLRALGVGPECLVGVLLERSTLLVTSLLAVLKAGGAYVPLDPVYPRERLRLMLEDANVAVLLTQQNLKHDLPPLDAHVVCLDTEWEDLAGDNPACWTTPSNLAYLIYTSGSTGKPKGAAIEHHSVVTLMYWSQDFFTTAELAGVLASTSVCFDLSVFEIFVPLISGGKVILAGNALDLPTLESADEVTLINTVPSAMTELIRMGGVPESVRAVSLAGEPLQKVLAQRIYALENIGRVLNLYGPSEDTTYSTWASIEKGDAHAPTIGRPIANTQVYLLDAAQQSVPIGVTGELFISGAGLVRGYLNRPALTAERFVPNPFSTEPGARMYRTGDLARYLSDGRIEFLGRVDHQVKLRGFRIELGEIETILGEHPAVRDVVVVARQSAQDQNLVAYFVTEPEAVVTPKDLRAYLLERLPKHMVPAFFVPLAELPLTPNGKVDRSVLPAPEARDDCEDVIVLPRTRVEATVASLWEQLLNRRHVSVHDDFFALGGHSLLAAQLVSRLREQFRVELPLRSIFETATIAGLSEVIENAAALSSPLLPVSRGETAPASFAQQRLWFLDQLSQANSAYNMIGGMRLRGDLNQTALARALEALTDRHEILRTTFTTLDGRPVQVIAAKQPVSLTFSDLSVLTESEREAKVRELAAREVDQPFDLTLGPLLRVALLRLSDGEHVVLVTMHHIIADGWSMGIFVKEFVILYEAFRSDQPVELAPLPIQYADYAHWQRERLRDELLDEELEYWRRKLAGAPAALELPLDHTRAAGPTRRARKLLFKLPTELSQALRELSRSEAVTLFMTLLAAFKTLLYRYTNQGDMVVGTAIAGRTRVEVENLIGIFINMLVLRTNLSGQLTFRELLSHIREVTLEAYAHQDVPFERLVEKLQPARTDARSPFFQVAFGLQQQPVQTFKLPGLELSLLNFDTDVSRYDLTLWVFEGEPELAASWTFSTDLFKAETIELMQMRFETLLTSIVQNPDARLATLEMFSDEEKRQAARHEQSSISKLLTVKRRAIRTSAAGAQ
jgi:amino acid adenylation domain-containing protein